MVLMAVVVEVFMIRKALLKEMRWCSKSSEDKAQGPERKIILEEIRNLALLQPEGRCLERGEFKNKQPDKSCEFKNKQPDNSIRG